MQSRHRFADGRPLRVLLTVCSATVRLNNVCFEMAFHVLLYRTSDIAWQCSLNMDALLDLEVLCEDGKMLQMRSCVWCCGKRCF